MGGTLMSFIRHEEGPSYMRRPNVIYPLERFTVFIICFFTLSCLKQYTKNTDSCSVPAHSLSYAVPSTSDDKALDGYFDK